MRECGFTLIEAMIAMAMIGVVIVVIFISYIVSSRIFSEEMEAGGTLLEATKSLDTITSELRQSREILSAQEQNITFWWKDINSNSSREANETITYSWSGREGDPTLRIIGSDVRALANDVKNFSLTYDNPANPKTITIKIEIGNLYTLEGSVSPRNL